MGKKVILVGRYYIIEPLGILHLLGLARSRGWDARVHLVKDGDFDPLYREIEEWKPDLVGFSIWTGYHLKAFVAADRIRDMGYKVVIGGPHATFFTEECAKHADWTAKGEAFRTFRRILDGEIPPGVHFDDERVAEGFPFPDRDTVYERYPHLAGSKIKSMMGSVGCPFRCSYCYAPAVNEMYGGFELNVRPVDQLVEEARLMKERWPIGMVYFQDDIFGYNMQWLEEFVEKWQAKVGIPWHCQIRLELTRHDAGERRLDLFRKGGCTGITLAVESGNAFLREFVLMRPMSHELILEGCSRIKSRGFSLRLEQILAVPFSDIETDIETLKLNSEINPEMAWTSILAPYGGTEMGTIASAFGIYRGNNDDLEESFFERSVLHQFADGRSVLEPHVYRLATMTERKKRQSPLLRMEARNRNDGFADVFLRDPLFGRVVSKEPLCTVRPMTEEENECYREQTVILQRLFNWLSMVPNGHMLGKKIVGLSWGDWTWRRVGELTREHFDSIGYGQEADEWEAELARRMGVPRLPAPVSDNPLYFVFFPSGDRLAARVLENRLFLEVEEKKSFDELGTFARRHLFETALYKVVPSDPPIAQRPAFKQHKAIAM